MNTRDNQRGGIVIFAVIGVLLAGLLAGGLYIGKQQARTAQENVPPTVAIDTEKEANETGDATPAPVKDEGTDTESTAAPASPARPEATPQAPASSSVASVPASGPSEPLPSTGPSSMLLGVAVVTAITFVGYVFVQSTLHLRRSALSR